MSDILSHELMLPERENLVDTLFDLLDEKGNVLSLDDQGQIPVTGLEDLIPLKEWARLNGISPATARQKAGRGALKTARKVGRDWMIHKNEPNLDHRYRSIFPALEGPVNPGRVLNYLLLLDPRTMLEKWKNVHNHQDYCRNIFFNLRRKMSGNEKILFNIICDTMVDRPQTEAYYISHEEIIDNIQDEALEEHTMDDVDFQDYLEALSNIVHVLLSHTIDLKLYEAGQTIILSWFKSLTWSGSREDGVYFVPSDFFKLIFYGLGE